MQNQFRLDELLARDVTPQWFEGVAVVQLVYRQLRSHGSEPSGFPRADAILIGAGGAVAIAGGLDGTPIAAAGHVLGLMLGNDVPVRLRLAITQATATESGYATLTEFSEALAYFERPNPEAIVEAFRTRAMGAARRETAAPVRVDAPVPVVAEKKPAPVPERAPRRGVSPLAVVAVIAGIACALIWMVGPKVADALAPKVVTAEREGTTAPQSPPGKKNHTVRTDAKRQSVAGTSPTSQPAEHLVLAPKLPAVVAPPQLQVVATTLSYSYPTSLSLERLSTFAMAGSLDSIKSDEIVSIDGARDASDRIYSQGDPQVTVPSSLYPKFSDDVLSVSGKGRTKLELTIAANGLVERVRMLSEPRNIHEFMLLSAAKAWRFEPAMIDGRPVRFRQVMSLSALP